MIHSPKDENRVFWFNQGLEYLDAKKPVEAIGAFQRVLDVDPNSGDAYSGIAHAFLDLGEWSGAQVALSRSVELSPTASRYVLLGGTLKKLGKSRSALRSFRNALRLSPENAEALLNVADIIQERHPTLAVTLLQKAIEASPDLIQAYLELGALLNRRAQYREAEQVLRRGLEQDPLHLWIWIELGNALWRMGKVATAERLLTDVSKRFPEAPEPLWTLAWYLEGAGRLEQAENLFKDAVRRKPTDTSAQDALAGFLRRRERIS